MTSSNKTTATSQTHRLGGWLPHGRKAVDAWLKRTIEAAEERRLPFKPVIREFEQMIERDPVLYMYFVQMFEQQPKFPPPPGSGDVKLKNYKQMLVVLNHILGTAPDYDTTGMVGFPINAILDFPMITPAGLAAFAAHPVNAMFREILAAWTEFLDSPDSLYVLNDQSNGWLSPAARRAIHLEDYQTDPAQPFDGFKSWNDFFIRRFKPGRRPVAHPDDDRVIVSACESAPYAIDTAAKAQDTFWIKAQPYSLHQLLNGHFVERFVGGTVYQAFLSAENYHRWHSPVSGTIRKIEPVAGTYYAEAASEGFDPAGPNNSQGYIAHVATRALIFIEADHPGIGLMALIPIGMAEVSSCLVTVREGQRVKKGDQIGYFQYGGSTHCLVFRPGVIAGFAAQAIPQGVNGTGSTIVKVNSYLATAN